MIINCQTLTEVLLVCKHFNVLVNVADIDEISFPYAFPLETVNGEPMPDEELSFEDFKVKYLNQ